MLARQIKSHPEPPLPTISPNRRLKLQNSTPPAPLYAFVDWCAVHGVAIHYIQPGQPDQRASRSSNSALLHE